MPGLDLYCLCGASWTGALPDVAALDIRLAWRSVHTGRGHGPTDARGAREAKRRTEDRAYRAERREQREAKRGA
jgi:hypothetical protein